MAKTVKSFTYAAFEETPLNVAVNKATRQIGEGDRLAREAFQASNSFAWTDTKAVAGLQSAYVTGRLIGAILKCDMARALWICNAKPPRKDGVNENGRRSKDEQREFRNATSAWSNWRLQMGAPSAQTGEKRTAKRGASKRRAGKNPKGDKAQRRVILNSFETVKSYEDCRAFGLALASLGETFVTKVEQRKIRLDLLRAVFLDFAKAMKATPEHAPDAQPAPQPAPVEAQPTALLPAPQPQPAPVRNDRPRRTRGK